MKKYPVPFYRGCQENKNLRTNKTDFNSYAYFCVRYMTHVRSIRHLRLVPYNCTLKLRKKENYQTRKQ
jgi:hypothetical protein